jgi:DNA polymerase III delta prime subunit
MSGQVSGPETTASEVQDGNEDKKRLEPRSSDSKRQSTMAGFLIGGQGPVKERAPLSAEVGQSHDAIDPDIEHDPNSERRKRRRMTPPESSPTGHRAKAVGTTELENDGDPSLALDHAHSLAEKIALATPESSLKSHMEVDAETPAAKSTPEKEANPTTIPGPGQTTPKQKMLRLSASGTIGSPPKKKETTEVPSEQPKKRRGRPPKTKPKKELLVSMKYNNGGAIGSQIDQIFNGELKIEVELQSQQDTKSAKKKTSAQKKSSKPSAPSKTVHPFFGGGLSASKDAIGQDGTSKSSSKTAQETPSEHKSPRKQSTTTPGKLRAQAQAAQSHSQPPSFGSMLARSGLEKHFKQPGLRDAPWPEAGMVHQRALEQFSPVPRTGNGDYQFPGARKMKHSAVQISPEENILSLQARGIEMAIQSTQEDELRLPQRRLISDRDIQQTMRKVVRSRLPAPESDDTSDTDDAVLTGRKGPTHPAVMSLYSSIESYLSPYDRHTCESEAWTQKYCPKLASHVLSNTKAPAHLRDWLTSLAVNSVNNGTSKKSDGSAKKSKAGKAKKRKKPDDMDNFIVYTEEDMQDTDEFILLDDVESDSPRPATFRSEVRARDMDVMSGRRSGKLANVTLISGPHGCGKTATVYAVAEELGFEIFEINSGTRRSGKDILDRVGDMTENHLVSRERRGSIASASDTGSTKKEINSGRQGTMSAFFKPTISKAKAEVQVPANKVEEIQPAPTSKPRKEQKQSLILFEEVDVLFEEDKNFWMTIFQLATTSKRPIVLTCNNEDVLPIPALNLHAILRLEPPNINLATDYMLLLAAREGHILSRESVSSLYDIKSYDLRASIVELEFWCQMAIGDRKGGLEWLYQRWPPGKDLDSYGRTLRVTSDGSYLKGMGWLHRDIARSTNGPSTDRDCELATQMWRDWDICPRQSIRDKQPSGPRNEPSAAGRRSFLADMDRYLETISAADVYCSLGLPGDVDQQIDASLPPISTKLKQSFTLSPALIEADPVTDFTGFESRLSVETSAIASSALLKMDSLNEQLSEGELIKRIQSQANAVSPQLRLKDFYYTFEPVMEAPSTSSASTNSWSFSSFDRPLRIITTDLAPYVRGIVAHELSLDDVRIKVSGLLSQGGSSKRLRTTKASRVASEGGERSTKRPDHWFTRDLNRRAVMKTAGEWGGLGLTNSPQGQLPSSQEDMDME